MIPDAETRRVYLARRERRRTRRSADPLAVLLALAAFTLGSFVSAILIYFVVLSRSLP